MKILMMTNTFTPHVGGVARSIETFVAEYRAMGHRVFVVAPQFEGTPENETDVLRVPAIQNFNGSDFSVSLPILDHLSILLEDFTPDIVHSHHPFLLGDTAVRVAASRSLPIVFTNHTMYDRYTHYAPGDSPTLKRFVANLATGYANLCDGVIAPSESVMKMLRSRGVTSEMEVVPTGVDLERFAVGDGPALRRKLGISNDAIVIGHLGRLAPEKNLGFLSRAVAAFLWKRRDAHFLVVGSGPSEAEIKSFFRLEKLDGRLHMLGVCKGNDLVDAYHAMDIFAFASSSETQGIVLAEAMAAGDPCVAVDAPGAREVIRDRQNGRLLQEESMFEFAEALDQLASLPPERFSQIKEAAIETAQEFSHRRSAEKAIAFYERLIERKGAPHDIDNSLWAGAVRTVKKEWDRLATVAEAAGHAILGDDGEESARHD